MSWHAFRSVPCSAAVHSSSTLVLSGSVDGTAKIWDLRAARVQRTLSYQAKVPSWVTAVAWNPESSACYLAKKDGSVEEWDYTQVLLRKTFVLPHDSVSCMKMLPNGRHLIMYEP